MKKICLLFTLMVSTYVLVAQQSFRVSVTDAKTGKPISNVSVKIKSTKKGVYAGADGVVSINAKPNDVLEISSIGYQDKNFTLTNQTNVSLSIQPASVDLSDVVIIGTRGAARAKTETAVPVDVIKINQVGTPTAKMDLTSVLNMAAPSFNYNKQSGADGADHIDLGTLRGLGPDQTLVLINGKRRHQTAFVTLFGSRGRGNSGADLNAFPQSSVDRIEILRDGASAQYGSDAMAGVINVVLKKDINHWSFNTGWAGYYDDKYNAYKFRQNNQYYYSQPIDGGTVSFSANNGLPIGNRGGFINFSLDLLRQEKTYRQVDTSNWRTDKTAMPFINSGRRAFGDGSVKTAGAMFNMEIPVCKSGATTLYSFGGYNYKASDAFAYTRNWSARPERFPTDLSGNLLFDPNIMRVADNGEIYYNPHIQTIIKDASLALGVKGKTHCGWNWDLSNTIGYNDFHFYGDKTFNSSIFNIPGASLQHHFDDGGFNFLQNTINLDFSKAFPNVAQGLNLGLGSEYRYEQYRIYKGEAASYENYHNTDIFYPSAGANITPATGAQGFPGFSPSDVIEARRNNISLYADAELNITKPWLVDGAVRYENYSDFGSVATFKFATRYKILSNLSMRGSISSGFRAPSLQQINFSNTLTSFSGGNLVQQRVARNGDAITKAAGIPNLKQETSINGSVGLSWKPLNGLTFTVDGYLVQVKNRIVLSGLFDKDDATLPVALTSQLAAIGVQQAQFFDNAVNTTNIGLDLVIDYAKKWGGNTFKATLAGNFQNMNVDAVHVPLALNDSYRHRKIFFSDREQAFLTTAAPKAKGTLSLVYSFKKFSVGSNLTYFGNVKSMGFGWTGLASQAGTGGPGDPAISGSFLGIDPYVDMDGYSDGIHVKKEIFDYKAKLVTDLYFSYKLSKVISIYVGADNIFNVHPDLSVVPGAKMEGQDNETGGPWESVQMGFNGRKLFGKISFNF